MSGAISEERNLDHNSEPKDAEDATIEKYLEEHGKELDSGSNQETRIAS